MKKEILKSYGADRLRRLNQLDDIDFSLKLDTYNIIPKVLNANIPSSL